MAFSQPSRRGCVAGPVRAQVCTVGEEAELGKTLWTRQNAAIRRRCGGSVRRRCGGVCGHRSAGQEQLAGMEPRRVEELMLRDRGEGQGGVTLCQAAELGFCPVSNEELTWS